MTRLLFDSTIATDIPVGSNLVGGYVDGSTAWSAVDWLRFTGRLIVRFCIFNNRMDANIIDIEPGNNDAKGAVPWVAAKWARGETPTVYCFSDAGPDGFRISQVRAECDAAGVKRPLFLIAQWDNDPSTFDPSGDPEVIGKQYANPTFTGGHYDKSVVADYWPGVDMDETTIREWAKQETRSVLTNEAWLKDAIKEAVAQAAAAPVKTHGHKVTGTAD